MTTLQFSRQSLWPRARRTRLRKVPQKSFELRHKDTKRSPLTSKRSWPPKPPMPLQDNDILFVPSSAAKATLKNMETLLPVAASATIYRVP